MNKLRHKIISFPIMFYAIMKASGRPNNNQLKYNMQNKMEINFKNRLCPM